MRRVTTWVLALTAVALVLGGYALGTLRRPPHIEPAAAASTAAAATAASPRGHALDTWKKLSAAHGVASPRKVAATTPASEREKVKTPLPTAPFGSRIAELEQRADDGDGDAAYALAAGFRDCKFFVPPKDAADAGQRAEDATVQQLNLADQITDYARDQAAKRGKTIDAPDLPVQQLYQANLDAANERARQCSGVDAAQARRAWPAWQRRAAELGNLDAEVAYWYVLENQADMLDPAELVADKQVLAAALDDALARGDARALIAIGHVVEDGLFAPPDPSLAYAYFYAAAQAPPTDSATLPWAGNGLARVFSGTTTQQYLQQQLALTGADLNRAQQLAAEQLGIDFYRDCCQGGGP